VLHRHKQSMDDNSRSGRGLMPARKRILLLLLRPIPRTPRGTRKESANHDNGGRSSDLTAAFKNKSVAFLKTLLREAEALFCDRHVRMRSPVAVNTAFAIAGKICGNAGSPNPVGGLLDFRKWTSMGVFATSLPADVGHSLIARHDLSATRFPVTSRSCHLIQRLASSFRMRRD
jgi:hypothetical protein